MKAAVFEAPGRIAVTEVADPVCGDHDIIIDVDYCGICGSDLHSYVEGAFVEPGQIMGHEFSGTVSVVGAAVTGISTGTAVTARPLSHCGTCPRCLEGLGNLCEVTLTSSVAYGLPGAFAERVRIPNAVAGENVFPLPAGLGRAAAACVEPMAVALRLAKSAKPTSADTAVVIGLGSIGLNTVQMLRALGAGQVIGIDLSPARLDLAARLGATHIVNAREQDTLAAVQALTGAGVGGVGARADIVVEASGVPALLSQAVGMTRAGGRLRIAALYESEVTLDMNQTVQKEMDISGSFAYDREFPEVLEILQEGRAVAEPLITHTFPLEDINEAFSVQLAKDSSVKVLVAAQSSS
ncbi:galactitol-1-phosphate 5-dehydrogenase [Amycolatopsis deserti]|uniref:Galactitol-1-phosphate 5-dehydrogenase n=1 Tax=Amycolatopsis deserti TaxID=185696 RepID=A0ABQ3IKX8_9PSEU|nr:zinc-binding dehydrogenase [Amycolatopsis deserti]GHE84327.1 galactitol-1-phosphate 5-dehydrogenase [Amycolatopsis deserti]